MADRTTAEKTGEEAPDREDAGTEAGDAGEGLEGFSRDELLGFLRDMLLGRRFEEAAEEAYAIGKIGGFCHLYIGQEATGLGAIRALRDDDYVITAYRDHAQALFKGGEPGPVMAELFGREGGSSRGKGGSMHIFDASVGFLGGHGIVGGHIPLAAGVGWAIHYREEDRVVLCFMGDAAVNQGAFHEALNMASVWSLPCIYVVENNEYGMGTAFERVSATEIQERPCAYGIPSTVVDGQDVLAVHRSTREAVERARSGEGPSLIEARTYRYKGHSMSDPVHGVYREKEEVEERKRTDDPISRLRNRMEEAGLLDHETLEEIDAEVQEVVDEAVDFADGSPEPGIDALYEHVYKQINEHGRLFFDRKDRLSG